MHIICCIGKQWFIKYVFNISHINHIGIIYVLDKKPPKEWPDKGTIMFENFYLRYSLDEGHVLKNLNIQIQAMEKVILTMMFSY